MSQKILKKSNKKLLYKKIDQLSFFNLQSVVCSLHLSYTGFRVPVLDICLKAEDTFEYYAFSLRFSC